MDMSKLSWMLVGLMPLLAVAADGTWETLSFAKGTYAPLDAYTRAGGKLVGAALKGETYPMALRNVTKAEVSEQGKLDVVVPAGAWVLHPAPQAAAVLRHAPAKAGPYDVTVTCAALKAGDGNPKTAGVDVTLLVAGAERTRFTLRAGTDQVRRTIRLAAVKLGVDAAVEVRVDARGSHICDATAVSLALARPETVPVDVPGAWTRLPPRDVDPKLSHVSDPIPRPWSGQKAALAFARLGVSPQAASRPLGADGLAFTGAARLRLDWAAAEPERTKPPLGRDPRGLWGPGSRTSPKAPITEPRLYTFGRSLRFFRDAVPDTEVLLPFAVVVDGNPEDGFGGYVLGYDTASPWTCVPGTNGVTLACSAPGARAFAFRFDGTWLAGLQKMARALDAFPALKGLVEARCAALAQGLDPMPDAELFLTVLSEWVQDDAKWGCPLDGWDAYVRGRVARRAKLLADPRLKETLAKGILFNTRRSPTWNHCVAQYFGWRQRPGGSLFALEAPGRSMKTRDLIAGRMPSGSYLEPRLSYDARRILFAFVETEGPLNPYSMCVNEEGGDDHYYHLWEIAPDGSGLKQLTRGVYEDFMPEFLPDGDIAFMSTRRRSQSRCFWFGYSNRWQAYTMFRMRPDGSEIRQLSWNDVAEWFPAMANNGELMFARWDYIDRDAVRHQNLWAMRPDGTNPKALWGNETPDPHCTFQIRAVPGSRKVACIASAHHAVTGGPLILIDPSIDENSEDAVTHVTPGHYPEIRMGAPDDDDPAAHNDWYNSPWPYGEDLFLVSWSRDHLHYEPSRPAPDASLGLYVLAADGTREVLYRDGRMNAMCPTPLVARPVPPKLESQFDPALRAAKKGEVFIADVRRGLKDVKPGALAQVRVVQIFPRTAPDQYLPNTGRGGHENARAVLGTAQVEADGSCRFLVPAEKAILFQVLDGTGRAWRTMRSTTSLMPGERVSCVGCHEPKREAGAAAAPLSAAMKKPAQELAVPPEGGRPWGFVENVQPILDAKCIRCHGDRNPPKGIALTRTPDPRFSNATNVVTVGARQYSAPFTRSYATLCFTDEPTGRKPGSKQFQWYKPRRGVALDGTPAEMVPCWPEYNHVQTTPEGPGRNALGSGLFGHLSRGKHANLLTSEELRMLATWIDLNATFYGCYEEPFLSRQLKGEAIPMPEHQ